jgi:hypothetical protein
MKEGRWRPDECPITGLRFFMWIDHPKLGYVPTYGGPFDSYTLSTIDEDGLLRAERYDHDEGSWVEGGAPMHARGELLIVAEEDPGDLPPARAPERKSFIDRLTAAGGLLAGQRHRDSSLAVLKARDLFVACDVRVREEEPYAH